MMAEPATPITLADLKDSPTCYYNYMIDECSNHSTWHREAEDTVTFGIAQKIFSTIVADAGVDVADIRKTLGVSYNNKDRAFNLDLPEAIVDYLPATLTFTLADSGVKYSLRREHRADAKVVTIDERDPTGKWLLHTYGTDRHLGNDDAVRDIITGALKEVDIRVNEVRRASSEGGLRYLTHKFYIDVDISKIRIEKLHPALKQLKGPKGNSMVVKPSKEFFERYSLVCEECFYCNDPGMATCLHFHRGGKRAESSNPGKDAKRAKGKARLDMLGSTSFE